MHVNSQVALQEALLAPTTEDRFADFVEHHRERAVRTAWRLTGSDRATAEEVAQEAFLRAHRSLGQFRNEAALSSWFYRILVRQAANHRRWRGVRDHWASVWRRKTEEGHPGIERDPGLRVRIDAAMSHLSHGQRTIFVLVYLEGFTLAEAAECAGCATGTAKSHLHRALKSLRAQLAEVHAEVSP